MKSRTTSKDSSSPSNRRSKDQRNNRSTKDKSGELDDIDKLFLDCDIDGPEVDSIDDEGQTGKCDKVKVAEEEVKRREVFDERPEKDIIVSQ